MKKTLLQFDWIVDHEKKEAGINIKGSIPVFVEDEANEKVEAVKEKVQELGKMLSDIFEQYTPKTREDDRDKKLDEAIEQAKMFGSIAKMMKDIVGEELDEDDQEQIEEIIAFSELAKLAELIRNNK